MNLPDRPLHALVLLSPRTLWTLHSPSLPSGYSFPGYHSSFSLSYTVFSTHNIPPRLPEQTPLSDFCLNHLPCSVIPPTPTQEISSVLPLEAHDNLCVSFSSSLNPTQTTSERCVVLDLLPTQFWTLVSQQQNKDQAGHHHHGNAERIRWDNCVKIFQHCHVHPIPPLSQTKDLLRMGNLSNFFLRGIAHVGSQ